MILGVNLFYDGCNSVNYNNCKSPSKNNNVAFRAAQSNILRNTGMAFAAATMLAVVSSCSFFRSKTTNDTKEIDSVTLINDAANSKSTNSNKVHKSYHYFPKEDGNSLRAEDYDWIETIYPDGRIERDSLEYKVYITPNGERTVVKTEFDESGNKIVTKQFPDGRKSIRKDYKMVMPKEIKYEETKLWPNGNMSERHSYNAYLTNKQEPFGEIAIEESTYKYNENEILLMWTSNQADSLRSSANNKYDKKGRLIYDDLKNEIYQYKKGAKHPYRAISEQDGCKRIKLLNSDGSIQKEIFKAKDGTITESTAQ